MRVGRRPFKDHLEIYLLRTELGKPSKEGKGTLCLGMKLGLASPSRQLPLRP